MNENEKKARGKKFLPRHLGGGGGGGVRGNKKEEEEERKKVLFLSVPLPNRDDP